MLVRALKTGLPRVAARRAAPVSRLGARTFAVDEKIPKDIDQQTGRRMAEIKYELETGGDLFSRDPIVPSPDQGTKENPILVPSGEDERIVGYEDPDVGQLVWFALGKGPIHYVPDIDLYFKLHPVG
mmetsp:Transcript_27180/g.89053  ORF Transcript_27180/g.89053 Transcript_27180/m.89053 type:complete len:127 (+) Transcript_27180:44-424(+)